MLRYTVTIYTGHPTTGPAAVRPIVRRGVTLAKAWRIVERAARRGVKEALAMGHRSPVLERSNWGARSGPGAVAYRNAVITMQGAR